MSRKIHKSLLSKLKKSTPFIQFSATTALSSSINRIVSGCKHPRALSFDFIDGDHSKSRVSSSSDPCHAATLSDIDRFLFENFSSLYQKNEDDTVEEDDNPDEVALFDESPRSRDPPLTTIGSSDRFFATLGSSSSLMEDARESVTSSSVDMASTGLLDFSSSSSSCEEIKEVSPAPRQDCIAVMMNSENPYVDFRLSMQEMIGARLRRHERVDWDFMENLLICYLNLNDKYSRQHILQAFVDLIDVDLRRFSDEAPAIDGHGGERRR